ncbi:MAG: PEP-CTERM sorting domain-containing protein [Planctomycetota bacterium]
MKAKFVIFSCVLFMGVIAGVAQAGVQQWPGTKWFQAPEMVEPWGDDIVSQYDPTGTTFTNVVMDDWLCTSNTPVKGFRWWGSYFNAYSIDNLTGFWLSIHADIPADFYPSHPDPEVRHVENFVPIAEIAYEQSIGFDASGNEVYEYFALLDECFWQQGTAANPVIYWVNIVAEIDNADQDIVESSVWGWHTAVLGPEPDYMHNLDDAVEIADYVMDTGFYQEFDPIEWEGYSLDMAFEVVPEPGTLLLAVPAIFGLAAVIRRRK